jgi:ABC-type Fe3+-siderophore transport system permease subunit
MLKKILISALAGGVLAFLLVWALSGTQSQHVRIAVALLCSGGGVVSGALLAAVLVKHEEEEGTAH